MDRDSSKVFQHLVRALFATIGAKWERENFSILTYHIGYIYTRGVLFVSYRYVLNGDGKLILVSIVDDSIWELFRLLIQIRLWTGCTELRQWLGWHLGKWSGWNTENVCKCMFIWKDWHLLMDRETVLYFCFWNTFHFAQLYRTQRFWIS